MGASNAFFLAGEFPTDNQGTPLTTSGRGLLVRQNAWIVDQLISSMHRQRCLILFSVLLLVFAPSLQARENAILPQKWRPDLSAVGELLEKDLADTQAQKGMNQLSRCLADLKCGAAHDLRPPLRNPQPVGTTLSFARANEVAEQASQSGGRWD